MKLSEFVFEYFFIYPLVCSGVTKVSDGECQSTVSKRKRTNCAWDCPVEEEPICGTDGQRYHNPCFLKIAQCE